jgi:hypothetical protein
MPFIMWRHYMQKISEESEMSVDVSRVGIETLSNQDKSGVNLTRSLFAEMWNPQMNDFVWTIRS